MSPRTSPSPVRNVAKPSPRVAEIVRGLPGRAGDVMQLHYRGRSDTQIAESLGITRSAVRQHRLKATRLIAKRLIESP